MHMRGEPATMQDAPAYADVMTEVGDFLAQLRELAEAGDNDGLKAALMTAARALQ